MTTITPRELSVIQLLVKDYTPKEIAAQLGVKPGTVRSAVWRVKMRFCMRSVPGLIHCLTKQGII